MPRSAIPPAAARAGNVGKRLYATLKHLSALRGAGLVTTDENSQDGRRRLYHLAPQHSRDEYRTRLGDGLRVLFGAGVNNDFRSVEFSPFRIRLRAQTDI